MRRSQLPWVAPLQRTLAAASEWLLRLERGQASLMAGSPHSAPLHRPSSSPPTGKMEFTIGGDRCVVEPGDEVFIPAGGCWGTRAGGWWAVWASNVAGQGRSGGEGSRLLQCMLMVVRWLSHLALPCAVRTKLAGSFCRCRCEAQHQERRRRRGTVVVRLRLRGCCNHSLERMPLFNPAGSFF